MRGPAGLSLALHRDTECSTGKAQQLKEKETKQGPLDHETLFILSAQI